MPLRHSANLLTRAPIEQVTPSAYTVPTDAPESDGTLDWSTTTIVIVEARTGNVSGIGYTYGDQAAADLIQRVLVPVVLGADAMNVSDCRGAMLRAVRNIGRPGLASAAISAVDNALWDAKAKLMGVSLAAALGARRDAVPAYGSGGFLTYSHDRLQEQLGNWAEAGIGMVKMKVGRDVVQDRERVRLARQAIGPKVRLFVDANGAYDLKGALQQAHAFADHDVTWFEEPVSSDDLSGLRFMRELAPERMEIAAGEYGYDGWYFRRMLDSGAVDVLQIDATQCAGISGFLEAAALCDLRHWPLSAHTAPHLHAHVCCAVPRARHVEYFHDHARIEKMFFDGALEPCKGVLRPDRSRLGLGIELKRSNVLRFAV